MIYMYLISKCKVQKKGSYINHEILEVITFVSTTRKFQGDKINHIKSSFYVIIANRDFINLLLWIYNLSFI